MGIDTTIAQTINEANEKIRYDEACKKLLSEKIILAWIMKTCLEEYKNLAVWKIASGYIEGTPKISEMPPVKDISNTPLICGSATEDIGINEQKIDYDVRFAAVAPRAGKSIRLMINVEAQNDYYPGYPLVKRALYYCGRMISGQYGTIFTHSHYEKLQKVYSIWLCMDAPSKRQKTITRYFIREECLHGSVNEDKTNYDLISVIMICLGEPSQKRDFIVTPEEKLIRLLEVLFSLKLRLEEKKQILEEEYDIPMTESIERLVSNVCNLSDRAIAEGLRLGIEQGICSLVEVCQEFGKSLIDTVETVAVKFDLNETESREKVERYWKKQ